LSEGSLADRAGTVLSRAAAHLIALQRDAGEWEGEVVWCTMILSQCVIVRHVTGRPLPEDTRRRIIRHYHVTRTPDGGWPLHREGPAQIFTTTLAYVALRMLGVAADHELTGRASEWLRRQPGGVLDIPTWGKFWLSLLDLYGTGGVATLPPELFLLPRWMPGHPRTWYCHTRYIYLAMSYLSGRGFKADLGPLRDDLRRELYGRAYETIDFPAHRDRVSPTDLHARPALALRTARRILPSLMRLVPVRLREKALRYCFARILYEQRESRSQALSPVNGLLNCLAIHATDPSHPELESGLAGLEAWRWCDDEGGIRYAGARSQVWDTAFATRALLQAALVNPGVAAGRSLQRAHVYLMQAQLGDELPAHDLEEREGIRGGWCFSDGVHRWPVSDCTAEALTAILETERHPGLVSEDARLPGERVRHALEFLIRRQNADGGFSTYEPTRAGPWLDRLNPAEMFRDCMRERSYVECTASAVEALATVRGAFPDLMADPVRQALHRGIAFLRRTQRADGTFPPAWGINLTYSIFHVTKALRAAGVDGRDPALTRAADWLRSTQRVDGGWGEHFTGSLEDRYVEHPRSQAVMTSWALLALADIDPGCAAIGRGVAWLQSIQRADGSWPVEAVNGVFFGTAMLDYALYVAYFPAWALGRIAYITRG
jgi:squalene/oxidosqualene cyclase-like protein